MSVIWQHARLMMRRLATIASLLVLTAGPFESLIPDSHDREDVAADVMTNAERHVPTDPSQDETGGDSHPFHLDHCAHSHLAAVSPAEAVPAFAGIGRRSAVTDRPGLYDSVVRAPHRRPPIA